MVVEIRKKKENEEVWLRKQDHVDRGKPGIRSDGHKPRFTLQAATNTRGQSVEGKDEPRVWDMGSYLPNSHSGFTQQSVSEFYCRCDYCVGREGGKLDEDGVKPRAWMPPL